MSDLIDRQAAIDALGGNEPVGDPSKMDDDDVVKMWERIRIINIINKLPSAHPEKRTEERTETHACDCISRQAAIDAVRRSEALDMAFGYGHAVDALRDLPSAQPERTCVNCGRTANNGGWYADGRTRCPIEEHYALPKDGYCHLWEKRNVTDDDYPERRTDEQ